MRPTVVVIVGAVVVVLTSPDQTIITELLSLHFSSDVSIGQGIYIIIYTSPKVRHIIVILPSCTKSNL